MSMSYQLKKATVFLTVCWHLLFVSDTLFGQRTISGCITAAEDGQPVPGATVFIANTSTGTITDSVGNYRLTIPGEGSYRLTVSHVGYQPDIKDIETGYTSIILDIALQSHLLDEVKVGVNVRFRQRDINLFWEKVLGEPPSRKTIYAVNPEDVYYFYNRETRILKVTCRVPLQIINRETGYHILLILDHFTHNYQTGISFWKYEYMFNELEPENNSQKNLWETNRQKVYQISLTNFIKSLYHDQLMENGFMLIYLERVKTYPSIKMDKAFETSKTLLSIDSAGGKTMYIPTDLKDFLMLVCFGKPVKDVIDKIILDKKKYSRNIQWFNYWSKMGLVRTMLETVGDSVRIYPDGTYSNPLMLTPCYSSYSLLGLNAMLPLDYKFGADFTAKSIIMERDEVLAEYKIADRDRFEQQLEAYPQEKLHLHTDRDFYVPGEKIWFKAYVVDAYTICIPPTPSMRMRN